MDQGREKLGAKMGPFWGCGRVCSFVAGLKRPKEHPLLRWGQRRTWPGTQILSIRLQLYRTIILRTSGVFEGHQGVIEGGCCLQRDVHLDLQWCPCTDTSLQHWKQLSTLRRCPEMSRNVLGDVQRCPEASQEKKTYISFNIIHIPFDDNSCTHALCYLEPGCRRPCSHAYRVALSASKLHFLDVVT